MTQVLMDAMAPIRVDQQFFGTAKAARLREEESAALRQVGMLGLHVTLVTLLVLEQVDEDLSVRRGQAQLLVDLLAHLCEFLEHGQIALDFEVGEKDELRYPELVLR